MKGICGRKQPESFASYDRDTHCWRTFQVSLLTSTLEEYSESWPRSGMMRNGIAYQLQPLVPLTKETGFGLWLTPRANEHCEKPETFIKRMGDRGSHCRGTLSAQVMWPTPHGFSQDGKSHGPSGNELGNAVNRSMLPTPTARAYQSPGEHGQGGQNLATVIGGSLNPTWVELLMGYPPGWTDLT